MSLNRRSEPPNRIAPDGRTTSRAWARIALVITLLVMATLAALVLWLNIRADHHSSSIAAVLHPGTPASQPLVERGRALAQLGHCSGCHTAPGGAPYAGGPALLTPFGTVYGGNLTPDPETGLGRWTSADFWRALHNGRSRDGRLLNPAFPYENFSHITREDSDALYAFLQSIEPVHRPAPAAQLKLPANSQGALAIWRAMHFWPTDPAAQALPTGEYLTRGLAHCSACHATRNTLGAQRSTNDFSGQLMPNGRAYAPPLPSAGRADAGPWTVDDLVAYLQTGHSRQGAALGVMAEVVAGSTQHVAAKDLQAIAEYVLSRPAPAVSSAPKANDGRDQAARLPAPGTAQASLMKLGEQVYADHCASCHGAQGEGVTGIYPPLAGNPRVAREPATNVIRIILEGGFGPATEGHPRPFGMPPFAHVLKAEEVAAVATYMRARWYGSGLEVTPLEVLKHR